MNKREEYWHLGLHDPPHGDLAVWVTPALNAQYIGSSLACCVVFVHMYCPFPLKGRTPPAFSLFFLFSLPNSHPSLSFLPWGHSVPLSFSPLSLASPNKNFPRQALASALSLSEQPFLNHNTSLSILFFSPTPQHGFLSNIQAKTMRKVIK